MKTTALRIHGKLDIRLDTFELPPTGNDSVLAEVIYDSICMPSHRAAKQGPGHKRVPNDCAVNPTIIGHEFSGSPRASTSTTCATPAWDVGSAGIPPHRVPGGDFGQRTQRRSGARRSVGGDHEDVPYSAPPPLEPALGGTG